MRGRCRRLLASPKAVWRERRFASRAHRSVLRTPRDPRLQLPSYVGLDRFLDVERLRALDAPVRRGLRRLRGTSLPRFETLLTRRPWQRRIPGARNVFLTTSPDGRYRDIERPELWRPAPEAGLFPELMDFVATLPFAAVSRVLVIFDDSGRGTAPHRDHELTDVCHEFIWLRTAPHKRLFFTDDHGRQRTEVVGYSAWFDVVNQFHGVLPGDGSPSPSIRVDGRFDDTLRQRIPTPAVNPASTPALWAALGDRAPQQSAL